MHFTAKPLLFVALVASLAVPQPLRACNHGGTEFGTCCHAVKADAVPLTASCCHESTEDAACALGSTPCTCSAPADPRNVPTERTTPDPAPLTGALALPAFAALPPAANASALLPPADPGGQAAIPHRILHCSWLI